MNNLATSFCENCIKNSHPDNTGEETNEHCDMLIKQLREAAIAVSHKLGFRPLLLHGTNIETFLNKIPNEHLIYRDKELNKANIASAFKDSNILGKAQLIGQINHIIYTNACSHLDADKVEMGKYEVHKLLKNQSDKLNMCTIKGSVQGIELLFVNIPDLSTCFSLLCFTASFLELTIRDSTFESTPNKLLLAAYGALLERF